MWIYKNKQDIKRIENIISNIKSWDIVIRKNPELILQSLTHKHNKLFKETCDIK